MRAPSSVTYGASFPVPRQGRCASLRFFNSLSRSHLTSLALPLAALGSVPTLKGEKPLNSHTQSLPLDGEEMATRDLTRDGTMLRAGSVRIPCYETKRKRSVYAVRRMR